MNRPKIILIVCIAIIIIGIAYLGNVGTILEERKQSKYFTILSNTDNDIFDN